MLKAFMRMIRGKGKKVENKIVNTEEYWDGAIEDLNKQYSKLKDKYHSAKGILDAKNSELSVLKRNITEMQITLDECKERYIETKSEEDKKVAERAFNKLKDYQDKQLILENEVSALEETYNYIKSIKENALVKIEEKKANAASNKSKIKVSGIINDLTEGLDTFDSKEMKGNFEVDSEYFKNKSKLEDMALDIPKKSNKNFEDFLNS